MSLPRLLMPTVRPPPPAPAHAPSPALSRSPRTRPPPSKLIRARSGSGSGSHPISLSNSLVDLPAPVDIAQTWIGAPLRFDILNDNVDVYGYQMYAVEKWIVERNRPVTVLVVYTGDPAHKISVTALSPSTSLSPAEAKSEWEAALHYLRRDGARPRETPHGILMATSLAHFRSDFTIVPVPQGNFLAVQQQLYTNINLLRMGCSGRSALTLEEPSETTKDRFLSLFHLPNAATTSPSVAGTPITSPVGSPVKKAKTHKIHHSLSVTTEVATTTVKAKEPTLFNATVLELVKLVQAGLAIFGMYAQAIDGLLCDVTVEGIQHWVSDIGEPCVGVEPTERVADPAVVSALLSLVLAIRNKLCALGYSHLVPKDPFLHPHDFGVGLAHYYQASPPPPQSTPHMPFHQYTPHLPHLPMTTHHSSVPSLNSPTVRPAAPLTRAAVDNITRMWMRTRQSESRKVHRVLLNKLDDLTAREGSDGDGDGAGGGDAGSSGQLLSGLASGLGLGSTSSGAAGVLEPTMDLGALMRVVVGKDKDRAREGRTKRKGRDDGEDADARARERDKDGGVGGVGGTVRGLWSGRIAAVVWLRERENARQRAEAEFWESVAAGRGTAATDKERWRERWALGVASDGDVEDRERERTDGRSTEEESDILGRQWPGRVQKRLEAWTGLNRKKAGGSVDLSALGGRGMSQLSQEEPHTRAASQSPTLQSAIFIDGRRDRDPADDDEPLSSGQVSPTSEARTPGLFPPSLLYSGPSADSSAVNLGIGDYERRVSAFDRRRPGGWLQQSRVSSWSDPVSARNRDIADEVDAMRQRSRLGSVTGEEGPIVEEPEQYDVPPPRRMLSHHGVPRRRSFHDLSSWQALRVLDIERMRIDVELCGQLLIMTRREAHLDGVLSCLTAITACLSATNTALRSDHESNLQFFSEIEARTRVLADIEAARVRADAAAQAANTLLYESAQLRVADVGHAAGAPRRAVLALRAKVFGAGGRRLAPGVSGAHGAFNRVQWTLDGRARLVDAAGRTESEAEEEARVVGAGVASVGEEVDEGDVVEHPGIKPMWLLQFFTRWGGTKKEKDAGADAKSPKSPSVSATSPAPPPKPSPQASPHASSPSSPLSAHSTSSTRRSSIELSPPAGDVVARAMSM